MVDLPEESQNQLFQTLADWNACLDGIPINDLPEPDAPSPAPEP